MARIALWGGSRFGGAGGDLERFLHKEDLRISFSGMKYKQLVPIAVDRCFPHSQAGSNMPCRAMGAGGVNGCQGASWCKELNGKELHGAAGGDLEPKKSAVSCASSIWSTRLLPSTSVLLW